MLIAVRVDSVTFSGASGTRLSSSRTACPRSVEECVGGRKAVPGASLAPSSRGREPGLGRRQGATSLAEANTRASQKGANIQGRNGSSTP